MKSKLAKEAAEAKKNMKEKQGEAGEGVKGEALASSRGRGGRGGIGTRGGRGGRGGTGGRGRGGREVVTRGRGGREVGTKGKVGRGGEEEGQGEGGKGGRMGLEKRRGWQNKSQQIKEVGKKNKIRKQQQQQQEEEEEREEEKKHSDYDTDHKETIGRSDHKRLIQTYTNTRRNHLYDDFYTAADHAEDTDDSEDDSEDSNSVEITIDSPTNLEESNAFGGDSPQSESPDERVMDDRDSSSFDALASPLKSAKKNGESAKGGKQRSFDYLSDASLLFADSTDMPEYLVFSQMQLDLPEPLMVPPNLDS